MSTTTALPRLNAEYLKLTPEQQYPEKVLQIGEGNFLRGFVDWMIHEANQKGLFKGRVVVAQPIAQGLAGFVNEQDGAYTLLARGMDSGKVVEDQQVITSISRCLNPYGEWEQFLAVARNLDIRFIVSNTTEAGIKVSDDDKATDQPPVSFPAKMTIFLQERFKAVNGDVTKGFVFLPVELIDRNGDNLKRCILETAAKWNLDAAFIAWVEKANVFTNTLVDRIVTGYPRTEVADLCAKAGYEDKLFNTSEYFHLWVIEGPASLAEELPLPQAGLQVIYTDNMKPYRERKVRILNGAHTATVLGAFLSGKDYVGQLMDDETLSGLMRKAIFEEVIPTLSLTKEELSAFAEAVFERFRNPFIKHALLDISLNSVSKYKARVLPSVEGYIAKNGTLPKRLVLGLTSLIAFYRGTEIKENALIGKRGDTEYRIKDDLNILETFAGLWAGFDGSEAAIAKVVDGVLSQESWWGKDLRTIAGLADLIKSQLAGYESKGVAAVIAETL